MKEKWKARQEQLHMCECSLGAREPGGGGAGWGEGPGRVMSQRGGFPPPAGEEPPQHHSSAKFRAKGLGGEDPADTLLEACL